MPILRKQKTLPLSTDELVKLAGVEMTGVTVSAGHDDGNVCTLTGDEGVMTFSRAELLAAIRLEDGYVPTADGVVGKAPETSRLPMGRAKGTLGDGDMGERHDDGRPHDHVDAGITFALADEGLVLSWLEDA